MSERISPKRKLIPKNKRKLPIKLDKCPINLLISLPLLLALVVFLLTLSTESSSLLYSMLIGTIVAVAIGQIGQQTKLPRQSIALLQILAVAIVVTGFCWGYLAEPAQAQFFKKAEDFFQYNLTQDLEGNGNTQAAVSLIFNVLRAIYLLYIAVSLIGVINAVRKDEDWQTVARTPLLVVVAVTIADVLTGFIVGDG